MVSSDDGGKGRLRCRLYQKAVIWALVCRRCALLTHNMACMCHLVPKTLMHAMSNALAYVDQNGALEVHFKKEPRALPDWDLPESER